MRKYLFLIIIPFMFFHCTNNTTEKENFNSSEKSYLLPKVLFITTGTEEGNGKLSQGVVIAIQSFNRKGAIVSIKSRDILKYPEQLKEYNFLILSTALGYHDADRRYSLSFMSDFEIENIKKFVYDGGVLIAGDNVGRNKMDGNDRISLYGQLTPSNWGLSDCFGVTMQEINMKEYHMSGYLDSNLNGQFKDVSLSDLWILVGDSVHSKNLTELAKWDNDESQYPAIIQNEYGKGISFLLPSSYFMHPSNDGGYWSASQIQTFYDLTLDAFDNKNNNQIQLNPWPNGHDQAFCLSLNSTGTLDEFRRTENFLKNHNIEATYFVNGKTTEVVTDFLADYSIQSNGFSRLNYSRNLYPICKNDIKENEIFWDKRFSGFRFPYSRPNFWGLLALNELGYQYESSIGVDNIEKYTGSVFPYQIPISNNSYYITTNILEVSPTFHDDYYFFSDVLKNTTYTKDKQSKDAKLFSKYLLNYWEYAVKPYNGLMVFMGHPNYVGYSDTTIASLDALLNKVREDNTWITSMDEIADYWVKLSAMSFEIEENNSNTKITIHSAENNSIENLSLKLLKKPTKLKVKEGQIEVVVRENIYYLIFDAFDGQIVELNIGE